MAETSGIPQWFTGSEQTHRVAAAIAKYGPIARTTLAQLLGLSQGALSRITADLIYAGVIEEITDAGTNDNPAASGRLPEGFIPKESANHRGRPQTQLALCANARTFIGIKVHGDKATAAAVNTQSEVVSDRHEIEFADDRSPQHVTSVIAQLAQECAADISQRGLPTPTAIGVAIGGHVANDDATVTFAPFLHWDSDISLASMVTESSGLPCAVFNDIDSLLVDACWFGPGVGYESFAVVTIGVGVGYSLAVRGEPINYPDKSYGLVGHVLIDPEGPRCVSGHIGCATCLTDDSLAEQYSAIVGRAATFEDFANDARHDVPQAMGLVRRTCFRLGTLIATIGNLAMPGMVMVAGESAFLATMAPDSVRDGIRRYRHSQAAPVKFVIAHHDWQLWAKAAAARVIVKHIG